jgi:hypothetical protein
MNLPWKKETPSSLTVPPFPPLKLDNDEWEAQFVLPSWVEEPRGNDDSEEAELCNGCVSLSVEPPWTKSNERILTHLLPEQIRAFQYLIDNEPAICQAIVQAVFTEYPQIKRDYEWTKEFHEDWDDILPNLTEPQEIKDLICPCSVRVWDLHKDDFAYWGIEFGCTWDEEHGFGIAMHKDRIVEMGDGSVHFSSENARREGGQIT